MMQPNDQLISQLRTEIYSLKARENQHRQIDQRVGHLVADYAKAFDQKERFDKSQQHRLNQNTASIISIRKELDRLKADITQLDLENDEKGNQIIRFKKMAESRGAFLEATNKECIVLQSKNRALFDANREIVARIRDVKQERKKLGSELEMMEEVALKNRQQLKQSEREARQLEIEKERLSRHLQTLRIQLLQLQNQRQLQDQGQSLQLDRMSCKQVQKEDIANSIMVLDHQSKIWTEEHRKNKKLYDEQYAELRELYSRKDFLEDAVRQRELSLEQLNSQYAFENEQRAFLLEDSITLSSEIQRCEGQLTQQVQINRDLQREVSEFIEEGEGETAGGRRQSLQETLESNRRQLGQTMSEISRILS